MSQLGILQETHYIPLRPSTSLYYMQSAQNASDSGTWTDIRGVKSGAFEFCNDAGVGAISSFSAQIEISNALTIPSNSTDGTVVGSAVTALGVIALPSVGRWMKVKVTALTVSGGGTLGIRLHGQNY